MEGGRRPRRALFGGARSSRTTLIGIGIVVASAAGYGCSGSDSDGVERTTTTTTVSAEQQEIFDRSAQIVEAWIGCLETTRSMMDEMLADPDSSVYVVIRNYGSESPVFRPMVDAYAETSRAWFTGGERGAGEVFFGLQTELCDQPWFVNEINYASVGSPLYWDPEYGLDGHKLTASGSDRSEVTADGVAEMAPPVAAAPESAEATEDYSVSPVPSSAVMEGPLRLTAASIGGVPFGASDEEVLSKLEFGPDVPGFGPTPTGECSTPDSAISWPNAAVRVLFDPTGGLFGYIARASGMTNTGAIGHWPIDIDGSGLGWGAQPEQIAAEFPDSSRDPLVGDMIVQLDDGLLYLIFDEAGLSIVRAGDFCSPRGVVVVGDF